MTFAYHASNPLPNIFLKTLILPTTTIHISLLPAPAILSPLEPHLILILVPTAIYIFPLTKPTPNFPPAFSTFRLPFQTWPSPFYNFPLIQKFSPRERSPLRSSFIQKWLPCLSSCTLAGSQHACMHTLTRKLSLLKAAFLHFYVHTSTCFYL